MFLLQAITSPTWISPIPLFREVQITFSSCLFCPPLCRLYKGCYIWEHYGDKMWVLKQHVDGTTDTMGTFIIPSASHNSFSVDFKRDYATMAFSSLLFLSLNLSCNVKTENMCSFLRGHRMKPNHLLGSSYVNWPGIGEEKRDWRVK